MNPSTISIIVSAKDAASRVLKGVGGSAQEMADEVKDASVRAAKYSGVALAGAITLAAKASWEQVSAVQQATVGLNAYERDGNKVNAVLKDLVAYARSDMGVLFNRKDLFNAAQSLKIMGDNTEDLTAHVKIMSRSVGLGLSTWDDLNRIVGRVGSTGRLAGDDFDNLTKAGYKLDPALRNTNITFDALFKALDKGIPVEAMEGQANTIQGLGIRMQTAFRGIGNAVLGVDADTNQFIKGGLGDRLTKAMGTATDVMKAAAPVITEALDTSQQAVKRLYDEINAYLGPKLSALWHTIRDDLAPILLQLWHNVIEPLIPVLGTTLVWAIGLVTDAVNFLIDGFVAVVEWMKRNNEWAIILGSTFGTLAAAMTLTAVFNALTAGFAFLTTVTIPGVMLRIAAMQALITAPLFMPAIAVGAAIASIALVMKAANDAHDAINNAKIAASNLSNSQAAAKRSLLNLQKNGTAEQKARANKALASGLYDGFASGGFTGRGGANDVAGIVHRGEYVIPKSQVDQSTGVPKDSAAGQVINNNLSGTFNFENADASNAFWDRLDKTQRLARIGMA